MSELVPPHGDGQLKPLLINTNERSESLIKANSLNKIPMSTREISDVLMFSMGAYSPLEGFMNREDWVNI